MNKLWTFGDSFITTRIDDNNWVKQIATNLNYESKSYGVAGSSLEYMYYNVDQQFKEFDKDDIVIIALTQLTRYWLFKDNPTLGNLHSIGKEYSVGSREQQFAEQYFVDHHNEAVSAVHLKNFLTVLDVNTQHMKIKPIIFSCFPDVEQVTNSLELGLNVVPGNLYRDVDRAEIRKEFLRPSGLYVDKRPNHMTPENHEILSNKVIDFIQNDVRF
jgi:hypothetical protein